MVILIVSWETDVADILAAGPAYVSAFNRLFSAFNRWTTHRLAPRPPGYEVAVTRELLPAHRQTVGRGSLHRARIGLQRNRPAPSDSIPSHEPRSLALSLPGVL